MNPRRDTKTHEELPAVHFVFLRVPSWIPISFAFLFASLRLCESLSPSPNAHGPTLDAPPPPPREFRAAWVATVANIDWPSKRGLPVAEQKRQIVAILDRALALNLNAIILQVRPACDALYASRIEPWSEYLTGTMGRPPRPYYDPLAMWVREAHLRG